MSNLTRLSLQDSLPRCCRPCSFRSFRVLGHLKVILEFLWTHNTQRNLAGNIFAEWCLQSYAIQSKPSTYSFVAYSGNLNSSNTPYGYWCYLLIHQRSYSPFIDTCDTICPQLTDSIGKGTHLRNYEQVSSQRFHHQLTNQFCQGHFFFLSSPPFIRSSIVQTCILTPP